MAAQQQDDIDASAMVQSWLSQMTSTQPVDYGAAERAVLALYRSIGLKAPRRIEWAKGPVELATLRERSWLFEEVGDNLVPLISDKLAHASCTYGAGARANPVATRRGTLISTSAGLQSAMMTLVDLATARVRVGHRMRRMFSGVLGRRKPLQWFPVGMGGRSQVDTPYLSCESYLYARYGQVPELAATLTSLTDVVANVGWVVPHEQVCWLSERPEILRTDPRFRLHAPDGPALAYRDGFEVHAWKGVEIPSWLTQFPESITVGRISRERDPFVRRCMIEIMTPAKFIAAGGARIVSRDETGTLWMYTSGFDTWAAVEVINGTPEPDGTRKHYFLQVPPEMRTARQAVAWTYDLTESQYAGLVVRT